MQVDLHVHSTQSDGKIVIENALADLFSGYSLVAFTDHEYIFDPQLYESTSFQTKFITGVELCCNHRGTNIEILGYSFDAENKAIISLVERIRELRKNVILDILTENGFFTGSLPNNPFRLNTPLPAGVDRDNFWLKYNWKYKSECHAISAEEVINTIISAKGIPVLAHPMESLSGIDDKNVERFILDLGIKTIELLTPKHNKNDIAIIYDIVSRNHLRGSIGSDSHKQYLTPIPYEYDIDSSVFEWIIDLATN